MFSIGICYLTGRAVATNPADRGSPEWPPHPDRVFMALVAAYYLGGEMPDERAALEWLECQHAPALNLSNAWYRTPVTMFVPVNDDSSPIKDKKPHMVMGTLPIGRGRQPRQFQTVIPENDTFYLIWREAESDNKLLPALQSLCSKVTYLGHSSSLVQMWLEPNPPLPNLVPVTENAMHQLRITGRGRLNALSISYAAGRRPSPSLWNGYATPHEVELHPAIPQTRLNDSLLIFTKTGGRTIPLESSLALTDAMRGMVMNGCSQQPPPEWISGHRPDGTRSEQAHLAFAPLAHVGDARADGHLLGIAMALPRSVSASEVARCFNRFLVDDESGEAQQIKLVMGNIGEWEIVLEEREQPPLALRSETWTRPARRWASVTPIVLDRYPKAKDSAEAEIEAQNTVATACEYIGLPRPTDIVLTPISLFIGAPAASAFPPLPTKFGRTSHLQTHALLTFAQPVRGPVLLGAGRYRGYGLCRPYTGWQGE